MVVGTRELASHPDVAERGLGEVDLRSLAKAGILPHSVVGGKFAFDLEEALQALDEHDEGGEDDGGEDEEGDAEEGDEELEEEADE